MPLRSSPLWRHLHSPRDLRLIARPLVLTAIVQLNHPWRHLYAPQDLQLTASLAELTLLVQSGPPQNHLYSPQDLLLTATLLVARLPKISVKMRFYARKTANVEVSSPDKEGILTFLGSLWPVCRLFLALNTV